MLASVGMQEVDVVQTFSLWMEYPLTDGSRKVSAVIVVFLPPMDSIERHLLTALPPNPSQSLWGWMKWKFTTPVPEDINHILTAWDFNIRGSTRYEFVGITIHTITETKDFHWKCDRFNLFFFFPRSLPQGWIFMCILWYSVKAVTLQSFLYRQESIGSVSLLSPAAYLNL